MDTETQRQQNPDLEWDLDDFNHLQRAMEFVTQFESTLCVYSPSVEQIYTTYNMFFPSEWNSKMVILPDQGAYHDTFFHIAPSAVVATGLYVIPGELIGKDGLFLANIDEQRSLGERQFPFESAIRTIIENRPADDPFLPVLAKGDLRELQKSWPVMHLHRVKPATLAKISDLDRSSLYNVINEKLDTLFVQNKVGIA
jgi:hypothetical protein